MYGVVVLMALSSGAETPDLFNRGCNGCKGSSCHGCCGTVVSHGCSSSCHGCSSSCHGCRGGLFGRHKNKSCHGCNGCNGCHGTVIISGCCGGTPMPHDDHKKPDDGKKPDGKKPD